MLSSHDLHCLVHAGRRGRSASGALSGTDRDSGLEGIGRWRLDATSALAWLAVGIPIAWGVWVTLSKALVLFG